MRKFNVNLDVKVKLTNWGREVYEAYHLKEYGLSTKFPFVPRLEDENGYSTWQLWHLMNVFGQHIGLGMPHPFELEILLDICEPTND